LAGTAEANKSAGAKITYQEKALGSNLIPISLTPGFNRVGPQPIRPSPTVSTVFASPGADWSKSFYAAFESVPTCSAILVLGSNLFANKLAECTLAQTLKWPVVNGHLLGDTERRA
jgi:hypothetical protein